MTPEYKIRIAWNMSRYWRYFGLSHLRELRTLARDGHPMHRAEARDLIKKHQARLAEQRQLAKLIPGKTKSYYLVLRRVRNQQVSA